jgi:hypothetical protein
MARQTGKRTPCFLARSLNANTTFLSHRAHRRTSRHDFSSPIGVAGVGGAVQGNSGIHVAGRGDSGRITAGPANRALCTGCLTWRLDRRGAAGRGYRPVPARLSRGKAAISGSDNSWPG